MINTIKAFAKVNLHLEVLNKRDDSFHNILSIMAAVEAHDLLKLEKIDVKRNSVSPADVKILIAGGLNSAVLKDIPPGENLISQAVQHYCKEAGHSVNAEFSIIKDLPAGAGLGGGSSNAAAALKLINYHVSGFSIEELMIIGGKVGADVPFCLNSSTCICQGTGDIIEPVAASFSYTALIINNGIHIDTKWAYQSLNRDKNYIADSDIEEKHSKIKEILMQGTLENYKNTFTNDFEIPVFSKYPELKEIKDTLYSLGAGFAIMTGSGSSIMGLFTDEEKALYAQETMNKEKRATILTKFL